MKPNEERIVKALETLDKMDFFQGQRAGRELWFDKPFEVQEQDITDFSKGIEFVKNVITDALALIHELTESLDRVRKQCGEIIVECDERDAERLKQVANLTEDNERLISDVFDLANYAIDKVRQAKADTARKMQERFSMILAVGDEIATDTAVDFLAAIAKKLLEEGT